jgi:hypothetical protein
VTDVVSFDIFTVVGSIIIGGLLWVVSGGIISEFNQSYNNLTYVSVSGMQSQNIINIIFNAAPVLFFIAAIIAGIVIASNRRNVRW